MAVLLAAVAPPAVAQLTNSDAPVDITADELEVVNTDCTATWRGNAEALQDTSRLRAQVLRLINQRGAAKPGSGASSSCGEMERMEAEGQVFYVTPQQRVRADNAVYVAATEMLTMTGDVVAVQGQNVIRGARMVINTRTGQGQMVGAATGRNAQGRVRGVIYPNQQQTQNRAAPR